MKRNSDIYNSDQRSEFSQNTDSRLSNRLRLLTKVGIVTLFLAAAVALPSLAAFSDHRQSKLPVAKPQTGNSKADRVIDVTPMMKNKQFREGLNHVYTGPGGARLSARVKGGRIADWIVTDKNGKVLPSTYSRQSKGKKCRVCIKPEGEEEFCFYVECKDIVVVPKGGTKQA